jgi:hypothetical protein
MYGVASSKGGLSHTALPAILADKNELADE